MPEESFEGIRDRLLGGGGPEPAILMELAAVIPQDLFGRAMMLVEGIEDPDLRARTFAAYAEHFPESRDQLFDHALRAIREIESEATRVETLATLASHLPVALRGEALEIIQNLNDTTLRTVALQRLRQQLGEAPTGPTRGIRRSTPRPVVSRPDALPTLLRRLPETERTALLEQVLDGLRGKVRVRLLMAAPPSEEPSGEPGEAPPRRTAPERVVNTGFAPEARPDEPRDPHLPLLSDSACYFWLEVGPPVEGSMEATPTALPTDQLPPEARLTVALFGFPGEIEVIPGGDVGTLRLRPDGSTIVERQPAKHQGIDPDLLARRLFFPVRVPDREGVFRLRVHICYEQVLIQSRLVSARVMRRPVPQDHALQSVLDYTLARALSPAHLAQMMPHRLNLMLNANGDGTHGLRLLGTDGGELFKSDAVIDEDTLTAHIKNARRALRRSAWGDEDPWTEGKAYRYATGTAVDRDRLKVDLVRFAIRGYRFYAAIITRLAGGRPKADALVRLMRRPGFVQVASKQSARHVIPAALLYDYPLETNIVELAAYTLCPEFVRALDGATPLESTPCFQGFCPVASASADSTVVCPSGFWGYRHALGLPLTAPTAPDPPPTIVALEAPRLMVGLSTDPAFKERVAHEQALRDLIPNLIMSVGDTRGEVLTLLRDAKSHVVYFYCHGGLAGDTPYLEVGYHEPAITPDNLFAVARWDNPRPLVFLNGCHTTALEPEVAFDFVGELVESAWAAGVIGTEITVFEPLARAFAEACLRYFLEGEPIGEAVRRARLKLLKGDNPLGLVYIPYVIPSLHLTRS